jgi:hypothetical protein
MEYKEAKVKYTRIAKQSAKVIYHSSIKKASRIVI